MSLKGVPELVDIDNYLEVKECCNKVIPSKFLSRGEKLKKLCMVLKNSLSRSSDSNNSIISKIYK